MNACTAGTTSELTESVRPAAPVRLERLAVLPVTAEAGSGDVVEVVAESAVELLEGWSPPVAILRPERVRERLGRRGLAAPLARVLADYAATGIGDPAELDRVTGALETPHLLQLRISWAESEVLREELFGEEVDDQFRREVLLVGRLWEEGATAPLWDAAVRLGSETGLFSTELPDRREMVHDAVLRLLDRLPVEGGPGSGDGLD